MTQSELSQTDQPLASQSTETPAQIKTTLRQSSCSFNTIEYHASTDTAHVEIDEQSEIPSFAITTVISAMTGDDVRDLPPLHTVIDPDALDTLLTRPSPDSDTQIVFRYVGHKVTASNDGTLTVRRHGED